MAPGGLTLFYGGLSQRKNVLNTIGMSYVSFLLGFLSWIIIGYSLAFSGTNPYIGDPWAKFFMFNIQTDSKVDGADEKLFIIY